MRTHFVTVDWRDGPSYSFRCAAPVESLCHARYTCECEAWGDDGIDDGRPWHSGGYDEDERHWGTFDATVCNLADFFDGFGDEMFGSIDIPVKANWEGDYYTFHVDPEPSPVVQDALPIAGAR